MATNNRESVAEVTAVEPKVIDSGSKTAEKPKKTKEKTTTEPKTPESVYTAEQLAGAHKTFDTSYEIVKTALKLAGKDKATITEAKNIIENFKNKEVK